MKTPRIFTAIILVFAVLVIANAQEVNIQAPIWVNPIQQSSDENIDGYDIYTLSAQTPIFQWTPPVVADAPTATYTYDFRVVELVEGQPVDYLMEHAPVFFQKKGLLQPQILIPAKYLANFISGHFYAAQVIAHPQLQPVTSRHNFPAQTTGSNNPLHPDNSTQTSPAPGLMPVVPQIPGPIRVFCIDLEPVL